MSKRIEELIRSEFERLVADYPRFRWVRMNQLFQSVKQKHGKRLTIRQFQKVIRDMWDRRAVELSRASIIQPHVKRYGIHTRRGVYFYVQVPKPKSHNAVSNHVFG